MNLAIKVAKDCAIEGLRSGGVIELGYDFSKSAEIDSAVSYRYTRKNDLTKTFLHNGDPGITGLASSLVVDQVISQLENEGYAVGRSEKGITILNHS